MKTMLQVLGILTLVAATAGAVAAGLAAQTFESGSGSSSGTSGYQNQLGRLGSNGDWALYGVAWDETSNKPCKLWLYMRRLGNGAATDVADQALNICGRQTVNILGFPIPTDLGADRKLSFANNPRYFVRGVAVCANSGNERLKGVRLYGVRVGTSRNPGLSNVSGYIEAKRPNCGNDEWDDPVFCRAGSVAWGVNFRYADGSVTGLGLRCRRVTW